MLKAYKYRIYPNKEQEEYFAKCFGCVRFIYNQMLSDRIKSYQENKDLDNKKIKYPTPAQYKKEYAWLKEVDSLALANAQINLDKAYKNFFRRVKQGDKNLGFPKFKSKKNNNKSYTTNNQGGTVYILDNKIKLPKLKSMIKIKLHRKFTGIIKSCTISQVPSGKYFISILVDTENIQLPNNNNYIGIDLGLKDLAITSDGEIFENPRWIYKWENKLKRNQRILSKMKKGSNCYNKQRIKVAKIHEKISNQRKDYLHKITTKLINENQVICLEDLFSSNLMKNKHLSKSITNVSWFEFIRQLEYKSNWYGRIIQKVDRWFPSSQICSNCGHRDGKKPLHIREWTCPICGTHHDRDINASINILNEGKRILGME